MGKFAKRFLENHWIDAEDRKGKASGGFCTRLPFSNESRIFMTLSNTMATLFTLLAHELVHAFHNEVFLDLTESAQDARMGIAETASTMEEMIVTQAIIPSETYPKEHLLRLDDHLSRSTAYLMNIYARFLYETRFYERRQKEFVSYIELSKLMEEAQKEGYGSWKSGLDGTPGIAIFPYLSDRKVIVNLNYRHATRSWEIEVPRGLKKEGETLRNAAARELKEETGYQLDETLLRLSL